MRRNKTKRKSGLVGITSIVLVIAITVIFAKYYIIGNDQGKSPFMYIAKSTNTLNSDIPASAGVPTTISNTVINSTNALLIQLDKSGNKIMFDKGGKERIYPASMTKIMTAIVALENIKDLDKKITLNEKMFDSIYKSNSSVAGFLPGEEVRAVDLLYGMMLPSGAECAIGLSEYVSGSESAFVKLMNKRARQIGMNDTHFTNTVGLHDKNHYSTAKDIAALVEYSIKNETFIKIFTSDRYSTKATNRHSDGITMYSTLFSNMESAKFNGGVILGGKTGYTGEAGQCLASLAEKNGRRFILVTCGAPGDNQTQQLHIDDAMTIYNKID